MHHRISFAAVVCVCAGLQVGAQTVWTGAGDGSSWTDNANWSTGVNPNSSSVGVVIDDDELITSDVVLAATRTIADLRLDAGDSLTLLQSASLTFNGGFVNNGTLGIEGDTGTNLATALRFAGDQEISGLGEIVLNDDAQNLITSTNATLTLGSMQTIRGAGQLLQNLGGVINNGTILAEGVNNALVIDPGVEGFVNNGTLSAVGAGGLVLGSGVFTNNTVIDAADGSFVEVRANAAIVGGELTTVGSGEIRALASSDFTGVTVTAGSRVSQVQSQSAEIRNGLTNNGTWSITSDNDTNFTTVLSFVGSQTLDGTGEIVLNDDAHNQITSTNATLTVGSEQTIRGAGQLLQNLGGVINNGTILAEGVNNALVINPGVEGFVNFGVLGGTGTFDFIDGILINDGTIAPGLSTGTLTWDGGLQQSETATLDLEIAGFDDFDMLSITGTFEAEGFIDVTTLGGFDPAATMDPSAVFEVLTASSVTGNFDNAIADVGTGIAAGVVGSDGTIFDVIYTDTSVLITNVVAIPSPGGLVALIGAGGVMVGRRRRLS
ncbi:MAG: hypothetical protein AAGI30_11225 [Planctomycetota bacterium]